MRYAVRHPHNLADTADGRRVAPSGPHRARAGALLDADEIDDTRPDLYEPVEGDPSDAGEQIDAPQLEGDDNGDQLALRDPSQQQPGARRGDQLDGAGRPVNVDQGVALEGDGLEDRTVGDLQDLARDRGIAGRSTMTKAELVAAIRADAGDDQGDDG